MDIRYYVMDNSAVTAATGWSPQRTMSDIAEDIFAWLCQHRRELEAIFK